MNYDASNVKKLLQNSVLRVEFTKVDGSIRIMNCTTKHCIVPTVEPRILEDGTVKAPPVLPEGIVRAFDVDAQGWRSFKIESVISIDTVS